MQRESAEEYLRRLSSIIRKNEKRLAESVISRSRNSRQQPNTGPFSYFNPFYWSSDNSSAKSPNSLSKPAALTLDTNRLYYVLMRIEALGIDVGTLDVQIDSQSRPLNHPHLFPGADKSDTISLASLRSSLSVISSLSIRDGWRSRSEPLSLDSELRYIYSSFTKLPALVVKARGDNPFVEFDFQNQNALPLDAFKNLKSLDCIDIDPRILLGWDRLAESLKSLRIKKSGLEDITEIFIGAVLDDQSRRAGCRSGKNSRRIPHDQRKETPRTPNRVPSVVLEEIDEERTQEIEMNRVSSSHPHSLELSSLKWAFLRNLSLSDNALTNFPSEALSYITSVTHLDLSSNLFVSVPPGLGALHNLVSLNVSDNMIDSVVGIYANLGQVLYLNLAHNRLEFICGLERLPALESVDLRHNFIEETAEIGRLAALPNITAVWVAGNPLVEIEESYRVSCFDFFRKEGKSVSLDDSIPGFYEKLHLIASPPERGCENQPILIPSIPPVVAVCSPISSTSGEGPSSPPIQSTSQTDPLAITSASGKPRKRFKRIVDFGNSSSTELMSNSKTDLQGPYPSPKALVQSISSENMLRFSADLSSLSHIDPMESRSRFQHSRSQSEYVANSSREVKCTSLSPRQTCGAASKPVEPNSSSASRKSRQPTTLSSGLVARRTRVSTSNVETPALRQGGVDPARAGIKGNTHEFRTRVEALRKDMGDGWLKVFTQSQLQALTP